MIRGHKLEVLVMYGCFFYSKVCVLIRYSIITDWTVDWLLLPSSVKIPPHIAQAQSVGPSGGSCGGGVVVVLQWWWYCGGGAVVVVWVGEAGVVVLWR